MNSLENEKSFLKSRLDKLVDERKTLNLLIQEMRDRLENIRSEEEEQQMNSLKDESEKIAYYLFEDGAVLGKRYENREIFWKEKRFFVSSTYDPSVNQVILAIAVKSDDSSDEWSNRVQEIIPHMKPISYKGDSIVFEIIESKEEEYEGEVQLEIKDGEPSVQVNHTLTKFKNLEEAFEYIKKHHSY